jgi:hypothetical protein
MKLFLSLSLLLAAGFASAQPVLVSINNENRFAFIEKQSEYSNSLFESYSVQIPLKNGGVLSAENCSVKAIGEDAVCSVKSGSHPDGDFGLFNFVILDREKAAFAFVLPRRVLIKENKIILTKFDDLYRVIVVNK